MLKLIITIGLFQAVSTLMNLVRAKTVAVFLGPGGVGVLSVIDQTVQLVAHIASLNLPFTAVNLLSKAHSEGEERFRSLYRGFFSALILLAAAGTGIAVLIAAYRPDWLGPDMARYRSVLLIAVLGIPAAVLGSFLVNAIAASGRPRGSASVALWVSGATALGACLGVIGGGLTGVYLGTVIGGAVVTAGIAGYLHFSLGFPVWPPDRGPVQNLRDSTPVLKTALLLYVGALANPLAMGAARYSALTVLGAETTGLMQSALGLALSLSLVLTPANGLLLTPLLNRDASKETKFEAANLFSRRLALLLALAVGVLALFPQLALTTLYSERFVPAAGVVFLFLVGQSLFLIAGVHQTLLIGLDDLAAHSAIALASYGVLALLSMPLAQRWGLAGIGAGYLLSGGVLFTLTLIRLYAGFDFRMPRRLTLSILWLASGGAALGVLGARDLPFEARIALEFGFLLSLLALLTPGERADLERFRLRFLKL